ncbi:MAG: carbohydrate ABC transporter permease [Candidatus Firestonebacteria bacterium]|nr:carbohydrate ABC transporter permease [Candidatus Firestonebacteria bacterium]
MEHRTLLSPSDRRNTGVKIFMVLAVTVMVICAAVMVVPFLWMVATSLAPAQALFSWPPKWFYGTLDFSSYKIAWLHVPFATYIFNSVIYCTGVVAGQLVLSSLAAYAFAKLRPPLGKFLLILFLSTLMIPAESLLIPLYLVMKEFPAASLPHTNLISTYWGLILPTVVSAFNILIMKSFFERLPDDLIDAARLDGCSEWMIFRRIVLPVSAPIFTVLGIFSFITTWNSFFWPLIVLNDPKLYTLMLGVNKMVEAGEPWNVVMAVVTLTTLPTIFIYLAFHKYIVRGVVFTGMQG